MELDKLIAHHQKCLGVLEMIGKCKRRKMSYQKDIHTSLIGSWCLKQIPIMEAVEQRLTTYYKNLISNHK